MYAIRVFGESLWVTCPIDHPAVMAGISVDKLAKPTSAPYLNTDFAIALERLSNDPEAPSGTRLYASLFTLLTLTSLRFVDTRLVRDVWKSNTALCGLSINNMGKSGALMNWAAPLLVLLGPDSVRYRPLLLHWGEVKPAEWQFRALFPHVPPERRIDISRDANFGAAQAQLSKPEVSLGFPNCANQLRFPREERERLGHWAPGSAAPGRYDKAVCATEIRLRNEILQKIRSGRRPQMNLK